MAGNQQDHPRVGVVGAGPVEAAPERVAQAGAGRTDVGVAVVAVHAPGADAAVGVAVLAGPPHVVDDAVAAALPARPHPAGDVGQRLFPAHPFPLALPAAAHPLQRIENALRVIGLVVGGRAFGAVAPAAARMHRVALELLDLQRLPVHIGEQTAGRLAVETDRGDQHVAPGDPLRPEFAVPFHPVVPLGGGRVLAHAPVGVMHHGHVHRLRLHRRRAETGQTEHARCGGCGGLRLRPAQGSVQQAVDPGFFAHIRSNCLDQCEA